jgi:hypothetical protein
VYGALVACLCFGIYFSPTNNFVINIETTRIPPPTAGALGAGGDTQKNDNTEELGESGKETALGAAEAFDAGRHESEKDSEEDIPAAADNSDKEGPSSRQHRRSSYPQFVLGHSTGHAGSTAIHAALTKPGCPWNGPETTMVQSFENRNKKEGVNGEREWSYGNANSGGSRSGSNDLEDNPSWSRSCELTADKLVPYLLDYAAAANGRRRGSSSGSGSRNITTSSSSDDRNNLRDLTYIDLGHYYNRGRLLECLADQLREKVTFVRIRRNRYDIARSFSEQFKTPCIKGTKPGRKHPHTTVCPRSGEDIGPVNLRVDDDVWDGMTPFQRFLWYADEMEHRWHTLTTRAYHRGEVGGSRQQGKKTDAAAEQAAQQRPAFHEITWSSSRQLVRQTDRLRRDAFGCTPLGEMGNHKRHVRHGNNTLRCSDFIRQDLEYRRLMNYDKPTMEILVSSERPQQVDSDECTETRDELEETIRSVYLEEQNRGSGNAADGVAYEETTWVLPPRAED